VISVDAKFDIENESGCRQVQLSDYLTPADAELAETSAIKWIKALRSVQIDGSPLRDCFAVRGDSLWWFVEAYLYRSRVVASVFHSIFALDALIVTERPSSITFVGGDAIAARISKLVFDHRKISFRESRSTWSSLWLTRIRYRWRTFTDPAIAWLQGVRGSRQTRSSTSKGVAAFVYTAFWKSNVTDETYLGPILAELADSVSPDELYVIGIGPRAKPKQRRWQDKVIELFDPSARELPLTPVGSFLQYCTDPSWLAIWKNRSRTLKAILLSEDLQRASVIRGYDVRSVFADEWFVLANIEFPWVARAMDQAAGALDSIHPKVVLTYAEAGGWGRALVLEARRRGIPVVAAQHGFIHRHWLNYLHESDEIKPSTRNPDDHGFPFPNMTLVYDRFTEQHLLQKGNFPVSAITTTGNPRLEAFIEEANRLTSHDIDIVREKVGAQPGQHIVLLASKYISQWNPAFAALVNAAKVMRDVHLVMKCHPADPREPYEQLASEIPNVTVSDAQVSLSSLAVTARVVVTVNSTAAIEAMVLNVPVLTLMLPNYLSPFVDAGAMVGIHELSEIAPRLRELIEDEGARLALAEKRQLFLDNHMTVSDAGSASRAARVVLDHAQCSRAASENLNP
jgi:hypothetical protein